MSKKVPDAVVRQIREEYAAGGVTTAALAERYGVAAASVGYWVTGHVRVAAGGPIQQTNRPRTNVATRFMGHVNKTDSCWLWTARIDRGYGQFRIGRKSVRAHRWSYEYHVGPIPDGLVLDHLCRNKACVNPDHLEPVTQGENTRRGFAARGMDAACTKGHPWTEESTYWAEVGEYRWRRCRICRRAWSRDRRARHRAA